MTHLTLGLFKPRCTLEPITQPLLSSIKLKPTCTLKLVTQPLSSIKPSPYQIDLHTYPRTPSTFELNSSPNSSQTCTSTYCSDLPTHSQNHKTDVNPFFHLPYQHQFLFGFQLPKKLRLKSILPYMNTLYLR